MKSYSAIVLAIVISVAASIPIEQIDEERAQTNAEEITAANGHRFGDRLISGQDAAANARPKRQFPDEVLLNKQFFQNIFHNSRLSRGAGDVPTIDLHDLISAVEHTLVHSAQNLAASNVTVVNSTTTETDPISNSSVTNVQHIVLPITLPTPKSLVEAVTTLDELTTVSVDHDDEEDEIEHSQSKIDEVYHVEKDYENVKPIEKSNLGILFPISLNPSADVHATTTIDEDRTDAPVTEETRAALPSNITIIQTINSTQLIPTDSDVVHVHQQQITLFSANAGIFPNIHAVKAEDLPVLSQTAEVTSPKTESEDCSDQESSEESDESSEESKDSSSGSSSDEKTAKRKVSCTRKPSSPTPDVVKKTKTDELKEKIAEVEADPVILTQGI